MMDFWLFSGTKLRTKFDTIGYPNAVCVDNFDNLDKELEGAKSRSELSLIEVKCSIGTRKDLVRPITTALENKEQFMKYIREE